MTTTASTHGLAATAADLYHDMTGGKLPVRIRFWDGSEAGDVTGPTVVLTDPVLLRRLLRHPRLGLADAYLAGEIDVDGDLVEALRRILPAFHGVNHRRLAGASARVLAFALRARFGQPSRAGVPTPLVDLPRPALARGRTHSRRRDRKVIAHHYDLSNDFYASILDPSMAYSCAYWTSTAPGYGLADAQRDKLAMICDKLRLGPGDRLLDLGCGWGSLALHAAREHGVRVTAATLSAMQHHHVRDQVQALHLEHLVEVRLSHYLDIRDGPYDAVACIEMGEHVGADRYPAFAKQVHHLLRPNGKALVQQMSRKRNRPGGGAFIETYIAPDMHMRPVGQTVADLERAGLEVVGVQGMRQHYARTTHAWLVALDRQWDAVVDLIGKPSARMWRLYLAGGALAFEQQRMGVDQILAIRPELGGDDG